MLEIKCVSRDRSMSGNLLLRHPGNQLSFMLPMNWHSWGVIHSSHRIRIVIKLYDHKLLQ